MEHPAKEPGKLSRWVRLRTLSLSTRYNFVENSARATTSNQGQYQSVVKGAFHPDPAVTKRFHRLKQANYHQFLFAKKATERILLSADYTFQSGTDTFREAVRVQVQELRFVDVFHFENYQVASTGPGYGFAAYGEKK